MNGWFSFSHTYAYSIYIYFKYLHRSVLPLMPSSRLSPRVIAVPDVLCPGVEISFFFLRERGVPHAEKRETYSWRPRAGVDGHADGDRGGESGSSAVTMSTFHLDGGVRACRRGRIGARHGAHVQVVTENAVARRRKGSATDPCDPADKKNRRACGCPSAAGHRGGPHL